MPRRKNLFPKRQSLKTRSKRQFARMTGIPTTKSGRQRKAKRMLTCGGCLIPIISFVLFSIIFYFILLL